MLGALLECRVLEKIFFEALSEGISQLLPRGEVLRTPEAATALDRAAATTALALAYAMWEKFSLNSVEEEFIDRFSSLKDKRSFVFLRSVPSEMNGKFDD